MNIEKFREILKEYTEKNLYKTKSGSTKLYCIRIPEKGVRYVRMEVKNENWVQIGLVEDVTVSMRERLRIEHERDYDTLTGLYNVKANPSLAEERKSDMLHLLCWIWIT